MSEWWTYRPSDFLMFAPATYWRLFELHNRAWWPLQPLLLAAGLAWLVWARRGARLAPRAAAAGLAAAWAFVAFAFLRPLYAPINWAASGFAVGFAVQAALLALLATRADLRPLGPGRRRRLGLLLCAGALLVYPLLGLVSGRPWRQAEVFGLAPDPTAIGTLGALLMAGAPGRFTRRLLDGALGLALLWCLLSAGVLLTMEAEQGWLVLCAGLLAALTRVRAGASGVPADRHGAGPPPP